MVLAAQRRTSSRLPRTWEKPARTCLLYHAAELQQAIAHLASAHVLVDVAPAALERAAEAWGPVAPEA